MANPLLELWWLIRHGRGWREERRTHSHPRLGQLQFIGRRLRPGGHVSGTWKVQPPGFDHPVDVTFQSEGNEPTPDGLAHLERTLGDLDGLFERAESRIRKAYQQTVERPMPAEWRAALRLDNIELPDPLDPGREWQVAYWCEAALHWFVVDFRGDDVTDVAMEG